MMSYLPSAEMAKKPLLATIVISRISENFIEEHMDSRFKQGNVNKEIVFEDGESIDNINKIILKNIVSSFMFNVVEIF